MPHRDLLGRKVTLPVVRFGPPGAFLGLDPDASGPGAPVVLLPGSEEVEIEGEGASVEVFVYLDSEDRPIATTHAPKLLLGEVAFLEVTDVTSFGAFFDWGLPKELLVPLGEQTKPVEPGDRHPIGLFVDDTGRLAGTMKVSEMLKAKPPFSEDEWVTGEAWRKDPDVGVFVILEHKYVGLLPASEPNTLIRGDERRFRVTNVHPDGKIEISLRGHAHEEAGSDGKRILAALTAPGAATISERASPEEIRIRFGLSKKAFKRAVGGLFKERLLTIAPDGTLIAKK